MTNVLVVLCTCPDEAESHRLARAIVEQRLAACVNILPPMRSVYRWKGEVETAPEVLMIVKTTKERFPALRDAITQFHSYETPEIVALPVAEGLDRYVEWIQENTRVIEPPA